MVSSQFFFFFWLAKDGFPYQDFLGIFLQEREKQQSKLWGLGGLLVSSLAKPHPAPSFPSFKLYKIMVKAFMQKDAGMIHRRREFHAACSHFPSAMFGCQNVSRFLRGENLCLWKGPGPGCFPNPAGISLLHGLYSGPGTCQAWVCKARQVS